MGLRWDPMLWIATWLYYVMIVRLDMDPTSVRQLQPDRLILRIAPPRSPVYGGKHLEPNRSQVGAAPGHAADRVSPSLFEEAEQHRIWGPNQFAPALLPSNRQNAPAAPAAGAGAWLLCLPQAIGEEVSVLPALRGNASQDQGARREPVRRARWLFISDIPATDNALSVLWWVGRHGRSGQKCGRQNSPNDNQSGRQQRKHFGCCSTVG